MSKSRGKIPLVDLRAQYRAIGPEVRAAIEEVLESQQFILGSSVREFEQQAATYLQCKTAIGVASGSDALLLSLMALGIGDGDGVLLPPFTFFSTASCITRLGATPIFIDIDLKSCLIDPNALEDFLHKHAQPDPHGQGFVDRRSGRQIKALLPVHLFGRCCPMSSLLAIAERYRLQIVEDVAQAFGARAQLSSGMAKFAGTIGDFGCFSFFPSKNLGGIGDGGLVATNQDALAQKVRILRAHGESSKYRHQVVGVNSRLDSIQAAVLSVKLRYIEKWCEARIERARLYRSLLLETGLYGEKIVDIPDPDEGKSHVFNYYVIRVQQREGLKHHLHEHGIDAEIYYPIPLHLQPSLSYLGNHEGDFPNSELVASQVLALPLYPELTPEQQETVTRQIRDFYRR